MSAADPQSGDVVSIFNPRKDAWDDHFASSDAEIIGLTPMGRATSRLLRFNSAERVEVRAEIFRQGHEF